MKRIEAIVRPHVLEELKEALTVRGVAGMTIHEVKGFGRTGGKREVYRGSAYVVDFVPKLEIVIVIGDDVAEDIVQTIRRTARTGQMGDGKIFVTDVERVVRIRTGELDEEAL